ncbi:MAG: hypothetical protein LBP19_05285 [Treponema sp.]|jgi:hypothetical protein|nr:hypothetical protein [Treponema sp.]
MSKKNVLLVSIVLFCRFFSLQARAETFSNIYTGLDDAERIARDLQRSNEDLNQQLQTLRDNEVLTASELNALKQSNEAAQTQYQTLQEFSRQMARDFQTLQTLFAESERRSKFWKQAAFIGIPTAAVIATGITLILTR